MEKTLTIRGKSIAYTLRTSTRARAVRIAVYPDERVVITIPHKMSMTLAEKFITDKSPWIQKKLDHFAQNPKTIFPKHTVKEIAEYKKQALGLATARLEYFNQFYGFTWKKVSTRNTKSRWGSCSKQGNLSFNYKIAFLSPELADYIVVHELCHLGELNHSVHFWNLVAQTTPRHKELRKELRKIS